MSIMKRALALAVVVIGTLAGMFVGSRVMNSPMVSASPVVAYTAVRGHDAVLVAYERVGGQIPVPFARDDQWQERVAAYSLDTGELLWDNKLHGHSRAARGVLAVAGGKAYVATDFGLSIVDTETGEIIADRDRIDGLGADYTEAYAAYEVDPRLDAVVALTRSGAVIQIPLGSIRAHNVPDVVAVDWRDALLDEWSVILGPTFSTSNVDPAGKPRTATLPDGSTFTFARPYNTDTAQLMRDGNIVANITDLERAQIAYEIVRTPAPLASPEQRRERLDRTRHHSSAALLGVADGVALVYGDRSGEPGAEELRLYDLDTGDVLATVDDFGGYVRATAAPKGRIVVIGAAEDSGLDDDRLIIFRADGRTTITTVGDTDFWGRPRTSVATP